MKILTILIVFLALNSAAQTPAFEWTSVLGGDGFERFNDIIKTSDGGYLCVGATSSITGNIAVNSGTLQEGIIVKLSAAGILEWTLSYGDTYETSIESVKQTPDGGYILGGYKSDNIGFDPSCTACTSQEFWALKITELGVIEWSETYGSAANEILTSVELTADGGYVFTGNTSGETGDMSGTIAGQSDIWVIKTSSTGQLIWEKNMGGPGVDIAQEIILTSDGGFILVGDSKTTASNGSSLDVIIIKLTENGVIEWQQTYGNPNSDDRGLGIIQTAEGDYLVCGSAENTSTILTTSFGFEDAIVFKINPTGTVIWSQNYGGTNYDGAKKIKLGQDGNYFIGGNTQSNDNQLTGSQGSYDAWVGKINPQGGLIWTKRTGGNSIETMLSLTASNDGGVVFVGQTNSSTGNLIKLNGSSDGFAIKVIGTPTPPANSDSTFNVSICGNSYTFQGTNYTASGTYLDTIPNAVGADSLLTLVLNINPIYSSTISESTCSSYLFNNQFLDQSGTYTAYLQSINGCDSTVTLQLTVLPKPERTVFASACESFTWTNGETYYVTTTDPFYIVEMPTGCDSTIRLNLTINKPNTDVSNTGTGTLTASPNTSYQWFDCQTQTPIASANSISFSPEMNGTYAVIVENSFACVDTSDCYIVDFLGINTLSESSWNIYPNPTTDLFSIVSVGEKNIHKLEIINMQGQRVKQYKSQEWYDISSLENGIYLLRLYTSNTNFTILKLEKR